MTNCIVKFLNNNRVAHIVERQACGYGVRKKQKWQEPENFCRWLGLKITESVVEKLDELMQYSGATSSSFQSAQDDWCNFRTQLIPWQRSNFPTTTTDESIVQLWSRTKKNRGFLISKEQHQKLRQKNEATIPAKKCTFHFWYCCHNLHYLVIVN